MTVMKIKEALAITRFPADDMLAGLIKKHLTAYEETHLFDGGSDYDYRVSNDRRCEDNSNGEHWLVLSFYNATEGYQARVQDRMGNIVAAE
jgi:hypothetical protein